MLFESPSLCWTARSGEANPLSHSAINHTRDSLRGKSLFFIRRQQTAPQSLELKLLDIFTSASKLIEKQCVGLTCWTRISARCSLSSIHTKLPLAQLKINILSLRIETDDYSLSDEGNDKNWSTWADPPSANLFIHVYSLIILNKQWQSALEMVANQCFLGAPDAQWVLFSGGKIEMRSLDPPWLRGASSQSLPVLITWLCYSSPPTILVLSLPLHLNGIQALVNHLPSNREIMNRSAKRGPG